MTTEKQYNYSKLKGRIVEKFDTFQNYAKKINISDTALTNKLQNRCPFKQTEIYDSIQPDVLDIRPEEIVAYFFTLKVGENQIKNN